MQVTYSLFGRSFRLFDIFFRVEPGNNAPMPDDYNLVGQPYRLRFSGNNLVISDNLSMPLPYEHCFDRMATDFHITDIPREGIAVGQVIIITGNGIPIPTLTQFIFLHDDIEIEISIDPVNTTIFKIRTSESSLVERLP